MALKGSRIAVLIPAYNEETQLPGVLKGIPPYVDDVVVVNDGSTDRTREVLDACAREDPRIHPIHFERNRGVGAAIAAAYEWAVEHPVDVAVSVDADGQMDPDEMIRLVRPIVDGRADVTKGNRISSPAKWAHIPRVRLFGNAVLSLLTKIASGYWSVADSQSGYVAVGRYAIDNIEWDRLYPSYGRPNDLLVRANVAGCRIADVPIRPVYGVGERSTMRVATVVFTISAMLFRRFWWRIFHKYVLRDFHPLVFFYLLATVTFVVDLALAVRLVMLWVMDGNVPPITALTVAFLTITTLNSVFFAFWMDMQVNDALAVRLPEYYAMRTEATSARPAAPPPSPGPTSPVPTREATGTGDGSPPRELPSEPGARGIRRPSG